MEYRAVTFAAGRAYYGKRWDDPGASGLKPAFDTRSTGDDEGPTLAHLERALDDLQDAFLDLKAEYGSSQERKDELEGRLVPLLHAPLAELPMRVLSDLDFWRYVSCYHLFEFAAWRDLSAKSKNPLPGHASFGVASKSLHPDTIALRMFNRGELSVRAAREGEDPYRIAAIRGGDVWKSHILRTSNRFSPQLARATLLEVEAGGLPATVMRDYIKRVKRVRANVLTQTLAAEDAQNLMVEEKEATLSLQVPDATDG